MATSPNRIAPSLEIRRTLEAAPEAVYRAWTEAAALSRWFAPSDEYTTVVATLETRVGGKYRIELHHTSGRKSAAVGEFRELVPPSRLSFTWRREDRTEMPETIVDISLTKSGNGTELHLTHRLFADETERDLHEAGWTGCLTRLPKAL